MTHETMHKDAAIHAEPGSLALLPSRRALIVLCGPVASGKTTLAMTHWPKAHIDTESIGWGESFKRVKERLGRGAVAVFDSTAVTTQVREKCLRLAKESSASAHIVLLNTSPGKCGVRNAERIDPVPDEVIAELRAAFESAQAEIPNEPWDSVTIL